MDDIEFIDEAPLTGIPDEFAKFSRICQQPNLKSSKLIIDVSNMAWRAYYGHTELSTNAGLISGHVYGSVQMLLSIFRNVLPPAEWEIYFAYDSPTAKAKRQEIVAHYKANRNKSFNPIPDAKEILSCIPGHHIEIQDLEGDDIINLIINSKLSTKFTIWSGDEDLWALLNDEFITIYSPNLAHEVTKENVFKRYGVIEPWKIQLCKSVFKETTDNLVGAPYIKKKYVLEQINKPECKNIYDLIQLMETSEHESTKKRFFDHLDDIKDNYEVVCPMYPELLEWDMIQNKFIQNGYFTSGNKEQFKQLLEKFECRSYYNSIHEFFGSDIQVKE